MRDLVAEVPAHVNSIHTAQGVILFSHTIPQSTQNSESVVKTTFGNSSASNQKPIVDYHYCRSECRAICRTVDSDIPSNVASASSVSITASMGSVKLN